MSAELCSQHGLRLSYVCAQQQCATIYCPACFGQHAQKTQHSLAVRLSQASVAFFLGFMDALIGRLDQALALLAKRGPSALVKSSEELSTHWEWRSMFAEVSAATEEVVLGLRNLSANNRDFVRNNSSNLSRLFHPQFFRDIYRITTEKWSATASRLAEDLRSLLVRRFPTRHIYSRLRFEFDPQLVSDVESTRSNLLASAGQSLTQQFRQPSKLSDLKISTVQSVIEDGRAPTFASVDSFYEVLENSAVEVPQSSFEQQVKEVPKSSISPNFLSYEALERQAEELLLENERLRQANLQLSSENAQLRAENSRLGGKEWLRK